VGKRLVEHEFARLAEARASDYPPPSLEIATRPGADLLTRSTQSIQYKLSD